MRRLLAHALLALAALAPEFAGAAAEYAWGHLPPDWRLKPGERMFLINRKAGEAFRVCLPTAVAKAWPTVEKELAAAANVWAHALGRTVDVRFDRRELPASGKGATRETLRKAYTAKCGGADLVFGFAPLPGQAVGETGFLRTTYVAEKGGQKKVTKEVAGGRYLFLRDLKASPVTLDEDGRKLAWAAQDGDPLARLKARDTVAHAYGGKIALLAVLVHEMGHVWGLCDLYDSDQLCDPDHSGMTRLPEGRFAAMGPVFYRQQLFLSDDDVYGVRQLAKRPGFDAGWKTGGWPEPPPVKLPDVEAFDAKLKKVAARALTIAYHVLTNRPARFAIEARPRGSDGAWQAIVDERTVSPKLIEPSTNLNLTMQQNPKELSLRLKLQVKDASGKWGAPRFVELKP